MRTWIRALRTVPCGGCAEPIAEKSPALVIENQGGKRVRCPACAERLFGEGPPTDLAEIASPQPAQAPRKPDFVRVGTMAEDYKLRQAGE